MKTINEFQINEYITLKLENEKTNIYVKNKLFRQCKYLLLKIPIDQIPDMNGVESIDAVADYLDKKLETNKNLVNIPPVTEFWGHCSNLQVWVEHQYDINLLHSSISLPLLKKLVEVGDPLARKVFKRELIKIIEQGNPKAIRVLLLNRYFHVFKKEEVESIFENLDYLQFLDLKDGEFIHILKRFAQGGNRKAKKLIKAEILTKLENDLLKGFLYLYGGGFFDLLNYDEFNHIMEKFEVQEQLQRLYFLSDLSSVWTVNNQQRSIIYMLNYVLKNGIKYDLDRFYIHLSKKRRKNVYTTLRKIVKKQTPFSDEPQSLIVDSSNLLQFLQKY